MKTVHISVDDEGQASVGLMPEPMDGMGGMSGTDGEAEMQPVGSVDEALEMARELLTGDPEAEARAETDMQTGYNSVGKLGMLP